MKDRPVSDHTLLSETPDNAQAVRGRAAIGRELIGFICVGGSGAVAFIILSTFMIGLRTGVPDWVMSALCWVALIGPVYAGHRLWSFRSGVPHRQALPRYIAVQICGIMLAAIFSCLFYRVLGMSTAVAATLVTALTSGVNFAILRAWAFAEGR
jgi:putative flippase GtrA